MRIMSACTASSLKWLQATSPWASPGTPIAETCVLNVFCMGTLDVCGVVEPQHFMYFLPPPHGQDSFLPTFVPDIRDFVSLLGIAHQSPG